MDLAWQTKDTFLAAPWRKSWKMKDVNVAAGVNPPGRHRACASGYHACSLDVAQQSKRRLRTSVAL